MAGASHGSAGESRPSRLAACAGGYPVTGSTSPATPLLGRLTAAHGWRHELARDAHGEPVAVVAVRIGLTWTDSVAIAGEHETLAMRHRTKRRPADPADRAALGIPRGVAPPRALRRRTRRTVRTARPRLMSTARRPGARDEERRCEQAHRRVAPMGCMCPVTGFRVSAGPAAPPSHHAGAGVRRPPRRPVLPRSPPVPVFPGRRRAPVGAP